MSLSNLSNLSSHGILLVDKPVGLTSHTMVAKARRILGTKKIGHSGTLDPFASGLLVLLVGEMVSLQSTFTNLDKEYLATFKFGEETDTLDPTGQVVSQDKNFKLPPTKDIQRIIDQKFLGRINQVPPNYSAIKIAGKRAYALSRENQSFTIPSREITIHQFKVISKLKEKMEVSITCGSGTYIRSLSRDLAKELGTVAHTWSLRRTKVGPLSIENAVDLDEFNTSNLEEFKSNSQDCFKSNLIKQIIPVENLLQQKNFFKGVKINLNEEDLQHAKHGRFPFLNRRFQDGYYFLSYRHRTLMMIEKNLDKIKVRFNLLKMIEI